MQHTPLLTDPHTEDGASAAEMGASPSPRKKETHMQLEFLERPLKFRPQGSVAGSWPHTPWFVCTLYDPYERINVWSHGLPAIGFAILCVLSYFGLAPGGLAMSVFSFSAAVCQGCSAITHIWPDDHVLEKIDHIGIPVLIVGTPLSAIMSVTPDGPYLPLMLIAVGLVVAAFCRPLLRTALFVCLGLALAVQYRYVVNWNLALQGVLYVFGAGMFIRNGGHDRPVGLQDHHFLHYCVTLACLWHVQYILDAEDTYVETHPGKHPL